jgi:hypothetical protein
MGRILPIGHLLGRAAKMDHVQNAYEDVKRNVEQAKQALAQMENLLEMIDAGVDESHTLTDVVNMAISHLDPRFSQNAARNMRVFTQQTEESVWNLMVNAAAAVTA